MAFISWRSIPSGRLDQCWKGRVLRGLLLTSMKSTRHLLPTRFKPHLIIILFVKRCFFFLFFYELLTIAMKELIQESQAPQASMFVAWFLKFHSRVLGVMFIGEMFCLKNNPLMKHLTNMWFLFKHVRHLIKQIFYRQSLRYGILTFKINSTHLKVFALSSVFWGFFCLLYWPVSLFLLWHLIALGASWFD